MGQCLVHYPAHGKYSADVSALSFPLVKKN